MSEGWSGVVTLVTATASAEDRVPIICAKNGKASLPKT